MSDGRRIRGAWYDTEFQTLSEGIGDRWDEISLVLLLSRVRGLGFVETRPTVRHWDVGGANVNTYSSFFNGLLLSKLATKSLCNYRNSSCRYSVVIIVDKKISNQTLNHNFYLSQSHPWRIVARAKSNPRSLRSGHVALGTSSSTSDLPRSAPHIRAPHIQEPVDIHRGWGRIARPTQPLSSTFVKPLTPCRGNRRCKDRRRAVSSDSWSSVHSMCTSWQSSGF